MTYIFRFICYE